jgi:hypothetical protein
MNMHEDKIYIFSFTVLELKANVLKEKGERGGNSIRSAGFSSLDLVMLSRSVSRNLSAVK